MREILSDDADDTFCRACATASGGNPFLLAEALRSLRADGVRPLATEAARVANLRPHTVTRAVLARLAQVGPEATRLARALAVLGPVDDLHIAGALAELTPEQTAAAGEALADQDIITRTRPIWLRHPLVRTVIYADGSDLRRGIEHKRATFLLERRGVPPEQLVPHLLATESEGDARIVGLLRAAAASARGRGAPEVTAVCLRRALAEPPQSSDRLTILIELAQALGMANKPADAADVLKSASELVDDPYLLAELALQRSVLMFQAGRGAEAAACNEQARRILGPREAEFLRQPHGLTLYLMGLVGMDSPNAWIDRLERIQRIEDTASDTGRMVDSALAFCFAVTGARPAHETTALAQRSASGELIGSADQWVLVNCASAAMSITDHHDAALELLDRGLAIAQRNGDITKYRYLSTLRSHSALYAGRLRDAEESGRAALDLHDLSTAPEIQLAAAVLIDALTERGALAEAQAILTERGMEQPLTINLLIEHFVLMARGRLRWRQNRLREALADYLNCGKVLAGNGFTNPAFAHWRTDAAQVLFALGEITAARDLAAENLELARHFEAPGAISIALRVTGLVVGDQDKLDTLAESVTILRTAGSDLELARALTDHGAALRRAGHRSAALPFLREGLDLAARCGAGPLVEHSNAELLAAGARPRRTALTGPDALTASELRVAQLAVDRTNRQIAQALFISLRTVEVHLTNSYRKLGIDSRNQLKSALAYTGP